MDQFTVGKKSEPREFSYTERDVILYALSIGVPADELQFVYEDAPGGLQVIPSFGTQPAAILVGLLGWDGLPGMLHGEHLTRVHRPIPPRGTLTSVGWISDIFDKGKAAVIRFHSESRLPNGELVCEDEAVGFYMGKGGFGGPRGPSTERIEPPQGVKPDFSVSYPTTKSQAALYRLNGDLNPLHIDPEVAQRAGQDRPILHGMCTFGFATRAIVHGACQGDVNRFRALRVRLNNVVFPGDTVTTEGWRQEDGRYIIQVRTDRDVVMTNAWAEVAE